MTKNTNIPFLNVSPEQAVVNLDTQAVLGYDAWLSMENEFREIQGDIGDEVYTKWKDNYSQWFTATIKTLSEVFVSQRYAHMFMRSPRTALSRTNVPNALSNIMTNYEQRLIVLNGYIDFIYEHFNVNISVVADRDIYIQGAASKMEIKNAN